MHFFSFLLLIYLENPARMENESDANIQYAALIDSMQKEFGEEYPEYYSGAYINGFGDLVVKIDKNKYNEDVVEDIREITGNNEILTAPADYSYNTLLNTLDTINKLHSDCFMPDCAFEDELSDFLKSIVSVSTDEKRNKIVVKVQNAEKADINVLKKYVDIECIVVENGGTALLALGCSIW